ncbi:glucose and ribitol dehydrogenase 1 [Fusarium sporotrichioides]|uniref:Glucose and ribitol dehydrogenase 1 n=1 Tax=Fusarium sporotrichioides TaxID=5514 RepID=A0A395S2U3_FUSSP|nr:glucose and ribitol dehydrogenase 1 [Fusarium sporotrichioides]
MASTLTYNISKLNDRRILIIGGSSGIGFGVAEAVIAHGASVIISSSSEKRLSNAVERLAERIPTSGGRVQAVLCDLSSPENAEVEAKRLFDKVIESGKLDHVVYTAGDSLTFGKIEDFTLPQIHQAGMVRFFGPILVAKHLRRCLNEGTASSFTLTGGNAPKRPPPDFTVVSAYLAGLDGVVTGLARDLAPIRVNSVSPGSVDTELWNHIRQEDGFEQFRENVEGRTLTHAMGKVEDVAESYLYLMKDYNATGTTVRTDGGMLIA